ncbi:DUF255 domain-containing protein [Saprospiraceae bacterium]|nr:DUF255 domain-containing protein [Saprospiraceae bacterium]
MKGIIFVCLLFLSIGNAHSQEIEWLTWEEVSEKMHEEPRKVVVDVYTEWCGWCKKMDASTFKNPEVVNYINENFYAIKFDAEYKKSIYLNGKEYKFIKSGRKGYHELAAKILRGKLSYPSLVFLDQNMKVIQPIPGYRDANTFHMIMNYFDGDHHKKVLWKTYANNFEKQKKSSDDSPEKSPNGVPVRVVTSKGN